MTHAPQPVACSRCRSTNQITANGLCVMCVANHYQSGDQPIPDGETKFNLVARLRSATKPIYMGQGVRFVMPAPLVPITDEAAARIERDAATIAELQARVEKLRATSIGAGVCYECDRVWSLGYPHEEHERDCPARPL